MNKKIKEINIKAFRAYKDEQKFDLMHKKSGKVADLVAIYAPNGYGKTSFFDAVEWAVTGTIERLNTGKPTQEEVRKEEKHILKNRDAVDSCGNVTIYSEDDDIFSINTRKKTGNMKSDFRPGEPVEISPGLSSILGEKGTFCTTNLLAHDKITGFLQNYTAEDKTNELRVMWDENNYSGILKEITELYNELEKRKKQLTVDILKEEKVLKEYTYENFQRDTVMNLLSNYETYYNKKIVIGTSFQVDEMLLLFNQLHEASQKEREEKEKECTDCEILLKEYPEYEQNKKVIGLYQKKRDEYNKTLNTWEQVELVQLELEKIRKEERQISGLLSKIEEFYGLVEKNNFNLTELRREENCKLTYQKGHMDVVGKIQTLENDLQENNIEKEGLSERKVNLKQDYTDFSANNSKKDKYERLLKKATFILENRNTRVQKLALYIDQIDLFLNGKIGIGLLYEIFPNEIFANWSLVEKLNTEKNLINENNDTLESNRKNLIGLYDKIQQLSIKGRNIVIEQELQACPLCHMEYESHEGLLDRIDVATQENIELEKIDEQIRKNKEKISEIDIELKHLYVEIETKVASISSECKEKYLQESIKAKKLQTKVELWERTIYSAINVCSTIYGKYQLDGLDISTYEQVINKEMEIEKQIKKINCEIEKIQSSIKNEKSKEKELEQSIKTCELKILEIAKENTEISTNPDYIETKTLLADKEFYNLDYNCAEMKAVLDNHRSQLMVKMKTLDKELAGYCIEEICPKDDCKKELINCQNEISRLQFEISGYILQCKKLLVDVKEEELSKEIKIANDNLKESLKAITDRMQKETSILVGLNGLREQKMWMSRRESIEKSKKKLKILEERIEKLQESKSYVEDYIVEKTNEYFNSDIINQIYNKIDPHPTMKHIKFIAQKESGGLKTRIYTYDDDSESNKMSPVVYLSSAQVNILSLCIFLAKVLSEKNTTFNTIFIDDPIQHLDGINLLSFIDVLRTITTDMGRQIVISTHNEQFYKLLKVKMDEKYYSSKFIELTSTGKIKGQ